MTTPPADPQVAPLHHAKSVLPVILTLISLFFFVTTAIFCFQTISLRRQLAELSAKISPTISTTNITTTITSSPTQEPTINIVGTKYHFRISLPQGWKKLAGPPEEEDFFNYRKGDYEISLGTSVTKYKTIQEYLKQKDLESQTSFEGLPGLKVDSTKLTKINDYSVVQRQEEWLAAAFLKPVINTYFLNRGIIYSVALKYIGSTNTPISDETQTYNDALKTLKLSN